MAQIKLTDAQERLGDFPVRSSVFLEGPAGCGKTTAAIFQLEKILNEFHGNQVLILLPQRSLGVPYQQSLNSMDSLRGGLPSILTIGALGRQLTQLFWPLVAKEAGFKNPDVQPNFLSTETAQYCMEKAITPYLEKGFFRSVTIEKNRLFGQLLDDLNKSAVVQFPLDQLASRLKNTSTIPPESLIAYDQVQTCTQEFRTYCLQNSLLDYSLLIEVLVKFIWPKQICRDYFFRTWRALIADNIEEDVPVAHDLVRQWIPGLDSSLLVFDTQAGYRQFLGADPVSAYSLKSSCEHIVEMDQPVSSNKSVQNLNLELTSCIQHEKGHSAETDFSNALEIRDYHFYPEMIRDICDEIAQLIAKENVPAEGIAILSPYLSDALNFSIETNLTNLGIPSRSSRPSRKYLAEPAVQAVLSLAKLAHPGWSLPVTQLDLRRALMVVMPDLDIVRANLVVSTLYTERRPEEGIRSFDSLTNRAMQERITFSIGEKLEALRSWLEDYHSQEPQPLDVFISRLYGEILSQNGFELYGDFSAAESIAKVVQSIRNFRQFAWEFLRIDEISSGLEYLRVVEGGLLPSAIFNRQEMDQMAVQVSPAHAFLMENRQVHIQYWLDIGAMGWWERLNQPLANPYLLNRNVDTSQLWTEAHEYNANQDAMLRVVEGLLNRCSGRIVVSSVRTNEYGSESRGPLQQAFQALQKRIYLASGGKDV